MSSVLRLALGSSRVLEVSKRVLLQVHRQVAEQELVLSDSLSLKMPWRRNDENIYSLQKSAGEPQNQMPEFSQRMPGRV